VDVPILVVAVHLAREAVPIRVDPAVVDVVHLEDCGPIGVTTVLRPEPEIRKAMALPGCQPGRSTISWTIASSSGVRWALPDSPELQAGGCQSSNRLVVERDSTLP
jgi:hypothetical protein